MDYGVIMNSYLKKLLVLSLLAPSIAHASSTHIPSQEKRQYRRVWSEGQLVTGGVFSGLAYGFWKLGELNAKLYEKNPRNINIFFVNVCDMTALGFGALAAAVLYWAIPGEKVWTAPDYCYKEACRTPIKKQKIDNEKS
jgi:hypothetical protein